MSGSLFQGAPQTATSYAQNTSETPKWMQDAIYNLIQTSTNIANRPYEAYKGERLAGFAPQQLAAYDLVNKNVGAYQPDMTFASTGMQGFSGKGTANQLQAGQAPYLRQDLVGSNLNAGQQLYGQAAGINIPGAAQPYLGQAASQNITGAAQPYLNRAASQDIVGAAKFYFDQAASKSGLGAAQKYFDKAFDLDSVKAADPYLQRASALDVIGSAQPYLDRAGALDIVGAAQPLLNKAESTTAQSLAERALTAANPYLTAAGQTSASQVGQYMSPYQQGVLDVIAKQGARNLSENLLPQVSDSFIKAGQFGSNRMGEFGSRALRDTQEAILREQSMAAQQGYGQSLNAAQADLARQAQLAGTVGSISGADLSRVLQGGAQYGNLGQTAGQLTGQQLQALTNLGQTTGQLTSQQMQNLTNIGQTYGQLTNQQMQALTNLGSSAGQLTNQEAQNLINMGQSSGQLTAQQAQSLANIGQTSGQLTGQQANIFANLGQTSGQLTGQQMQNLANIGQMQTSAGQNQQQFGLTAAQQAQAAQAQDYVRQMSALQSVNEMARQNQALRTADAAALESAGAAEQNMVQRIFDRDRAKAEEDRLYPQKQLDWLSTQIRGIAPSVPTVQTSTGSTSGASYSPSPLSQLATGIYTAKGLASI